MGPETSLLDPAFKKLWLEKMKDGSFKRKRMRLIDYTDETSRCCIGAGIAVGAQLGLISKDRLPKTKIEGPRLGAMLPEELLAVGLSRKDEYRLIVANDRGSVPEGMYYPKEVFEVLESIPVRE